jgi:hypothetical protein
MFDHHFLKNSISCGSWGPSDTGKMHVNGSSSLDLGANKCDLTDVFLAKSKLFLNSYFIVSRLRDVISPSLKSLNMIITFSTYDCYIIRICCGWRSYKFKIVLMGALLLQTGRAAFHFPPPPAAVQKRWIQPPGQISRLFPQDYYETESTILYFRISVPREPYAPASLIVQEVLASRVGQDFLPKGREKTELPASPTLQQSYTINCPMSCIIHDQVPGTIRYLARSGTWHDLVPGTIWQIHNIYPYSGYNIQNPYPYLEASRPT